jgi:hypothetical protein
VELVNATILEMWRLWRARKSEMKFRSMAVGVNSSVDIVNDLHVVFLDYDGVTLQQVEESVKELQKFWRLSDMYVYKTRHGFHVIGYYDQIPYDRLKMIINYARFVDPMFKLIGNYYDHKTLRVSGKYAEMDIWFVRVIRGVRRPSVGERRIGGLKLKEHDSWISRFPRV